MLVMYAILFLIHLGLTSWFYLSGTHLEFVNYSYNFLITLFTLIPFTQGFFYNKKFPQLKPIIIPLQISNFLFAVALYIWFYFNITGQVIPYPSLADLFFLIYYPATIMALLFLARKTNIIWTISLTISTFLIFAFLSGICVTFLSYQTIDFNSPVVTTILNLSYPMLDSLLAAIGITILRSQKDTSYRYLFFYVFGYVFLGFADTLFSYQTNFNLYWNGNFVDLMYATSHMSIALGTHFLPTIITTKSNSTPPTTISTVS